MSSEAFGVGGNGHPPADPSPPDELERTLAALESSLRSAADQVTLAREQLGGRSLGSASSTMDRTAGATRARMREGPLGHLFRSTVGGSEASLVDAPPGPAAGATGEKGSVWLEAGVADLEPRLARIVSNSEHELGTEHPDTLWAVHDLVSALAKAGDGARARRLAARLVGARTRTLGPDHPHTIRAYQLRGSL